MISKSTEEIFVARNEILDSHIHFSMKIILTLRYL